MEYYIAIKISYDPYSMGGSYVILIKPETKYTT